MKSIDAAIDVAATPSDVWRVLTNFGAYSAWNPFLNKIDGEAALNAAITVHVALGGGASLPMPATVVDVVENEKLVWRSETITAGLFDRDHIITLVPSETGCTLTQSQTFDGPIAAIAAALADGLVRRGLAQMNDALKRQVETTGGV
jgi:hypothetical protein